MSYKVIITGTTGMVGKGVLLECLESPEILEVLIINRNPLGMSHPKLKEIIHQNFFDFTTLTDELKSYDACYFCMGVSSIGLSEAEFLHLTYDTAVPFAKLVSEQNSNMVFCYVSGTGTDSSETGKTMWARVKGKTENDILKLGFKQAFAFRPGAIIPLRGIEPSSKMYRTLIKYLKWLIFIIKKVSPNSVVNTTQIGLAMINVTQRGYSKSIIRPADILILADANPKP